MIKKDYTRRPNTSNDTYGRNRRIVDLNEQSGYRYEASFPSIFKDENLAFIKAFDVFHSDYMETRVVIDGKNQPMMRPEDEGLWLDLSYAAERKEQFKHDNLAYRRGMSPHTLAAMLDRLEDMKLIIRVKGCSGRGHPTHLLVCAPYEPGWHEPSGAGDAPLYIPGEIDEHMPVLIERVQTKHTEMRRKLYANGRGRVANFPEVKWDAKTLRRATLDTKVAQRLHAVGVIIANTLFKWQQDDHTVDRGKLMAEVRELFQREYKETCPRKMFETAMFQRHVETFRKDYA